jgi:hypothetical protein
MKTPQWFVQVLRECSDGNLSGLLSPQAEFLSADDEFLGYKEKLIAGLHLLEEGLPELALEVKEVLDAIAFAKNASFVASSSLSRGLLVFLQPDSSWSYLNFLFEVVHEETHLLLDLLYLVLPPLTTEESNLFYLANLQNVVVYASLFLVVKELLSGAYSFSASDGSCLSGVLEEFQGQAQHFHRLLYSLGAPPLTTFWSDFVTGWAVPVLKGNDPIFNIGERLEPKSWSLREIDVSGISWDRR